MSKFNYSSVKGKGSALKDTKEDLGKLKKAVTTKSKGAAKGSVNTAAKRAAVRVLDRAGWVGTAAMAGHAVGEALNDKFKISDKIVNTLSPSKDVNANRDSTGKSTKITMGVKKKATPKPANKPKTAKKGLSTTRTEFNKEFSTAKKSGKSEFTFKGKKYNTKLK